MSINRHKFGAICSLLFVGLFAIELVASTAIASTIPPAAPASVMSNPNNKLEIIFPSTCCPDGTVGISYSQSLFANGGVKPYHWSIARGELPSGLQISSGYPEGNPGLISGTPTVTGTFGFVVRVTDFEGNHVDMNGKITIH